MNTKTTLALILVAGALLGGIVFYESKLPRSWESPVRDQYLLSFDKNRVEGIDILSTEDKVELRRRGAKWFMESPVKDRVNPAAIAEILTKCESLAKEPVDGCRNADKKQLKAFGLIKPSFRLKLLGRGMPPEILLGKDTAVEGKMYARLEGSNTVWVISSELHALMTRKPDEFRDPMLADIRPEYVNKFSIKTPAGDIDLTRDSSRSKWNIIKPIRARADGRQVVAFLESVLQTQIGAFLPENKGNLNSYGLSEPRGGVTFHLMGEIHPMVLEIGARDEKTGRVYGRFSNRGVCLLPKASENILSLEPNNLRDRNLLRIDMDAVDWIKLSPAGKPAIRLMRAQEEWVVRSEGQGTASESMPANKIKILQAMNELLACKVKEFVTDVASDLGKYGFDQPQLQITFSSYSSENTADTQAGERPIQTVIFGKTEGDMVYARLENEPFVVSVPASILHALGTGYCAWRHPVVSRFKPAELKSFTLIAYVNGFPRAHLTFRTEGGNWFAGEKTMGIVNRKNILQFIKTLSCITAQEWTDEPGPLVPAMMLELNTANRGVSRLVLGAASEDGSTLASFQGKPGIFRLSPADSAVLRVRLLDPVTP